MKKLITLATIAIVALSASMTTSAQRGYRGFADASIGANADLNDEGYSGAVIYGIATTHGYQINKCFIGIGLGIFGFSESAVVGGPSWSAGVKEYSTSIPLFAQFRYDKS